MKEAGKTMFKMVNVSTPGKMEINMSVVERIMQWMDMEKWSILTGRLMREVIRITKSWEKEHVQCLKETYTLVCSLLIPSFKPNSYLNNIK